MFNKTLFFRKGEPRIITLSFTGKPSMKVGIGDQVDINQVLFTYIHRDVLESHNLVDELDLSENSDFRDYIARLPGEFVTAGQVIAERVMKAGLVVKSVYAQHDGIVNMERLNRGFLDIVAEESSKEFSSPVKGKVIDIDYNNGIKIETDCIIAENIVMTDFVHKMSLSQLANLSGVFTMIGDGTSVYTVHDLDSDYSGKVVWMGRYFNANTAVELLERGARFLLVHAIDYKDFLALDIPLVVFGGFGQIPLQPIKIDMLKTLLNGYFVLDYHNRQLIVAGQQSGLYRKPQNLVIPEFVKGQTVIIKKEQFWGLIGVVQEIVNNVVIVDVDGKRLPIEQELLDVIETV